MQEKKLIREGKNISILKEQNHKLNKSILMLQKPKDEEIELRNENEMLKRKLVKFENQLLKFQTPKMGEIPQLEEIDRCLSRVSNIYSKASIDSDRDYQSQRDEHLESLEKELAIMRAKEKAYLATQSAFEQKMQSLEDKFKTEAENTRGLSRDLAYANRQIESLKNELLQTELDATNAETRSYINY